MYGIIICQLKRGYRNQEKKYFQFPFLGKALERRVLQSPLRVALAHASFPMAEAASHERVQRE